MRKQPHERAALAVFSVLWVGSIVLLHLFFRTGSGARITLPYGQYAFFALTVVAAAGLTFLCWRNGWWAGLDRLPGSLLLLLLAALFVSAAVGLTPTYGIRLAAILVATSLPFVLAACAPGLDRTPAFALPVLATGLTAAIGAVVLEITGPVGPAWFQLENFHYGAPAGWSFLFLETNGLASHIAITVPTLIFVALTAKSRVMCGLLGALLLGLLAEYTQTTSRSSLGWILVSLVLFATALCWRAVETRRLSPRRLVVGVAVMSLALVLALLPIFGEVVDYLLRPHRPDILSGRLPLWFAYLDRFPSDPLLGFGFGASGEFLRQAGFEMRYPSAHNVYIGLLGETGLVGLGFLLILWAGAVVRVVGGLARTVARPDPMAFYLGFWLLAMLGGLAVHQIASWSILRVSPIHYLFVFVLVLAWRYPALIAAKPQPEANPRPAG